MINIFIVRGNNNYTGSVYSFDLCLTILYFNQEEQIIAEG
jgi:hypothetical protein